MNSIKKGIVTGVLAREGRLDSVRALSIKFEVNLNTILRACSEMERQGVIYIHKGVLEAL